MFKTSHSGVSSLASGVSNFPEVRAAPWINHPCIRPQPYHLIRYFLIYISFLEEKNNHGIFFARSPDPGGGGEQENRVYTIKTSYILYQGLANILLPPAPPPFSANYVERWRRINLRNITGLDLPSTVDVLEKYNFFGYKIQLNTY